VSCYFVCSTNILVRVEFPDYTGNQTGAIADNTYMCGNEKTCETRLAASMSIHLRLLDVGEEATIKHDGQEITINVNMLRDIKQLGAGYYGCVMLVEVDQHPDVRMAVKVSCSYFMCAMSPVLCTFD
jgi:hypothetical protein